MIATTGSSAKVKPYLEKRFITHYPATVMKKRTRKVIPRGTPDHQTSVPGIGSPGSGRTIGTTRSRPTIRRPLRRITVITEPQIGHFSSSVSFSRHHHPPRFHRMETPELFFSSRNSSGSIPLVTSAVSSDFFGAWYFAGRRSFSGAATPETSRWAAVSDAAHARPPHSLHQRPPSPRTSRH